MGIKIDHEHEGGKVCYVTSSRRPLTKKGFVLLNGEMCAVAYMVYTGSWYAYDTVTGREIASFDRAFYDRFLAPYRIGDLVDDPDCRPANDMSSQEFESTSINDGSG